MVLILIILEYIYIRRQIEKHYLTIFVLILIILEYIYMTKSGNIMTEQAS